MDYGIYGIRTTTNTNTIPIDNLENSNTNERDKQHKKWAKLTYFGK
jgi:hypothetical protein